MRQMRRILRLQHEGMATGDIVRVTGIARTTIQRALNRARSAGVTWPLADEVTDDMLMFVFIIGPAAIGNQASVV